ncbi:MULTISPECIES: toxic anion resistance protein [unclassified Modicisalibacter]|uniref:toxic anion resistance protein n=1 Tax=unclassified Modicisalibacter TaxID=2679913 RepID=UPI001CCD817D|nr:MULTISPECIES: toxic anion resistance protein [unclassified Modicisalibacter]MBZ9559411.1 toxic anion resistance protein [Modicisalibacter sp. R2A 31.J]MBZ9576423.1 toxic anion resistance protein [Modicisalibacter sp. MOD 31.J]
MTEDRHSSERPLALPPVEEIAERLDAAHDGDTASDDDLAAQADAFVEVLFAGRDGAADPRQTVDEMGLDLQRESARQSEMLKTPLRRLAHQGDEGGPVAKSLMQLRERMSALDPQHQSLENGGLDRILARLPGVGSRLQRYFQKFENAQQALDAIIHDLESGRDMLRRDNLTLADDQASLRDTLDRLARQVALGRLIDERLERRIVGLPEADAQRAFIEEELLFPLRQRIVDLQQQQAVSQQGVLALEVVIRNNRELMRGVDRAINVTVAALNVAVTVAMALANQRLVLDRVEALNSSTSAMIKGTAKALRSQGVEIQSRAAEATLDRETLEEAFSEVMAALDDVARYRREALPRLDEQIDRLDALASRGGEAIERLERGNREQPGESL